MKKITFIIISVFSIECFCLDAMAQRSKKAVIFMSENSSGNVLRMETVETLDNIDSNIFYIDKEPREIKLELAQASTFSFSHKNAVPCTVNLFAGDTAWVISRKTEVVAKVKRTDYSGRIAALVDEINQATTTGDSLLKILYEPDLSKPLFIENDYAKLVSYPMIYHRENATPSFLAKLASTLMTEYQHKLSDIEIHISNDQRNIDHIKKQLSIKYLKKITMTKHFTKSDLFDGMQNQLLSQLCNSRLDRQTAQTIIGEKAIIKKDDYSRSKQYLDYKEAYVNAPKFFKDEDLKYARYICIQQMLEMGESIKDLGFYLNDFIATYPKQKVAEKLRKILSTQINKYQNIESDLVLLDTYGKKTTLKELISHYNTQTIYIDFWASWCVPCISAFPAARKLRVKLGEKSSYLYISLDNDPISWKRANAKYQLPPKNSFLALNKSASTFIKKLEVITIPRYVILDKNLKILNPNAPGPENAVLYNTLTPN